MKKPTTEGVNLRRRNFLAVSSASLAATLLRPTISLTAEPETKVKVGLIGCGGRGQWVTGLFKKHGGYEFVAAADYFQDKVDAVGTATGIPAERRFTGLSGYKRLLEQQLDAVVIISPPYFHPEQATTAVDAGKHVYLAKPIAVDVPGCLKVEAAGRRATDKKLIFLVDFQTRTHPLLQECAQQIHRGGLGQIICAEASYQTGPVGETVDAARKADPKNPELRLRAWVTDRVLSGDIITEQNIHSLDLACWLLDAAPERAYGSGGKRRNFVGDCWDHFSVIFYFPKGIVLTFSSKQAGYAFEEIMCRVYGTNGTADTHYFGKSFYKTRDDYVAGDVQDLYTSGAEANIATFHTNVAQAKYENITVAPSVRSNLTTILGRMAAYKSKEVSWEKMMAQREVLEADLRGLKS